MRARYCYWSVVDGDYSFMMATAIESARRSGVFKDFHVWSDRAIEGAIHHPVATLDKSHYLFKLTFLRDAVKSLNYDYFVWIDADTYFVRNPGDVLWVMQGSPVHASLESDACDRNTRRPDWWGCPLPVYAALMEARGVRSRSIFNANAGLWIVHRDVIETFCALALDFWHFCRDRGHMFTEEAPLAYATHMLCGNPHIHTLRATTDLWVSDWTGHYQDTLPDGQAWWFVDYFNEEKIPVNPAIVHAMRSKSAMIAAAKAGSQESRKPPN
jgi:hypothetical protein